MGTPQVPSSDASSAQATTPSTSLPAIGQPKTAEAEFTPPPASPVSDKDSKVTVLDMTSLHPAVPVLDPAEVHPSGTASAPASPVDLLLDEDEDEDEDEDFGSDDEDNLADRGLFWKSERDWTPEEEEAKKDVRRRVLKSAFATLGTAADITADLLHEALELGVDFLDLAPVPGLASAAKIVLNIWDAVENVDMNHMACLRLIERCADLLLSVRMEVKDAGDIVAEELKDPLSRLERSYDQVLGFLQKNNHIPFIKRYLKRDDIQQEISGLDMALRDALNFFGLQVQIRILKQVQEAERQRQKDTQNMLMMFLAHQPVQQPTSFPGMANEEGSRDIGIGQSNRSAPAVDVLEWSSVPSEPVSNPTFPMPEPEEVPQSPEEIQRALNQLLEKQNSEDMRKDKENLKEVSKIFGGKSRR